MAVRVTFKLLETKRKIQKATKLGLFAASTQALKDSNFYAKQDSGKMIASSIRASDLKEGKLIWDTPYARRQYYLDATSKDTNPNAQKMWAEVAAKRHGKQWKAILQKAIDKGV